MTTVQNPGSDHRRTMAVAEDAQRIAHLAQELQRNALELEGQSHKLRGTLEHELRRHHDRPERRPKIMTQDREEDFLRLIQVLREPRN